MKESRKSRVRLVERQSTDSASEVRTVAPALFPPRPQGQFS